MSITYSPSIATLCSRAQPMRYSASSLSASGFTRFISSENNIIIALSNVLFVRKRRPVFGAFVRKRHPELPYPTLPSPWPASLLSQPACYNQVMMWFSAPVQQVFSASAALFQREFRRRSDAVQTLPAILSDMSAIKIEGSDSFYDVSDASPWHHQCKLKYYLGAAQMQTNFPKESLRKMYPKCIQNVPKTRDILKSTCYTFCWNGEIAA